MGREGEGREMRNTSFFRVHKVTQTCLFFYKGKKRKLQLVKPGAQLSIENPSIHQPNSFVSF